MVHALHSPQSPQALRRRTVSENSIPTTSRHPTSLSTTTILGQAPSRHAARLPLSIHILRFARVQLETIGQANLSSLRWDVERENLIDGKPWSARVIPGSGTTTNCEHHHWYRLCHAGGTLLVVRRRCSRGHEENQLRRIPVPARGHTRGDLALSPVHTQLSCSAARRARMAGSASHNAETSASG